MVVVEVTQCAFVEDKKDGRKGPEREKLQKYAQGMLSNPICQKGNNSLSGPILGRMFHVTVKSVHLIC